MLPRSRAAIAAIFSLSLALTASAASAATPVCSPSFANKVVTLKDKKGGRALSAARVDGDHLSATTDSGAPWQRWKVEPAGGCYYYLTDQQHRQQALAGDRAVREPIFHEAHRGRDNAQWQFLDAGDGHYYLVEKKHARYLLAADDNGDRLFSYYAADATPRVNARWKVEVPVVPDCNPALAGRVVTVTDARYNRSLSTEIFDTDRTVARPYAGNSFQNWQLTSAGDCHFYLTDEKHGQALVAADDPGVRTIFHEPHGNRDNAKWQLMPAGAGRYHLIDKKGRRALVAGDAEDVDTLFGEAHGDRLNAQWTIAAPPAPQCADRFLAKLDDPGRRQVVEVNYSNPFSNQGFQPQWSSQAGVRVEHTQASARLPDRAGKAYFAFTSSENYGGWMWVVEVDGVQWTRDVPASAARVVWFRHYKDICPDDTCNAHDTEGNFNHPAQIARVTGGNIMAVALQNWTGKGGEPKRHLIRGSDSVAFYDVTDPRTPRFMFRLVGSVASHWGGQPPGNDISKATLGKQGSDYFLMVGDDKKHHYKVPQSALTTATTAPPGLTPLPGGWKGHDYTDERRTLPAGSGTLLDVDLSGSKQLVVSAARVDPQNNRQSGACQYGPIDVGDGWRNTACGVATGFSHRSDTDFAHICHWKKPREKFILVGAKP